MLFKSQIKELRKKNPKPVNYALFYVEQGLPIIPLHWIENGKCSCGREDCPSPGKHPIQKLVKKGIHDATTDHMKVALWFQKYPKANIGLATGKKIKSTVLDFDRKEDQLETFEALADHFPWLTNMMLQRSGGDGVHVFMPYREDIRNVTSIMYGLDIRNDNAYVLVEPSKHVSGGEYKWLV